MLFVSILISGLNPEFRGLYQRIIESLILIWIIACALKIKRTAVNKELR
jgi:hypothetical protein